MGNVRQVSRWPEETPRVMEVKYKRLSAGAVIAGLVCGPQARADVIAFGFGGAGVSGSGLLTFVPDTVIGDPGGAYTITNISGTFSDSNSNLSIANVAITGLVPINPVSPPLGAPIPVSLSYLSVVNPPPMDSAISYDNLFYPDGSPITCPGYPLAGGFLDVYGALFTLSNNDVVDLWSNGEIPGMVPLSYGAGVVNESSMVIDYQPTGVSMGVPEPGSLWLLGAGLLGVLGRRKRPALSLAIPGGRIAGTP
jgi:PEP-CTERM motif